ATPSGAPPDLPSFPTRRSSDLPHAARGAAGAGRVARTRGGGVRSARARPDTPARRVAPGRPQAADRRGSGAGAPGGGQRSRPAGAGGRSRLAASRAARGPGAVRGAAVILRRLGAPRPASVLAGSGG